MTLVVNRIRQELLCTERIKKTHERVNKLCGTVVQLILTISVVKNAWSVPKIINLYAYETYLLLIHLYLFKENQY